MIDICQADLTLVTECVEYASVHHILLFGNLQKMHIIRVSRTPLLGGAGGVSANYSRLSTANQPLLHQLGQNIGCAIHMIIRQKQDLRDERSIEGRRLG